MTTASSTLLGRPVWYELMTSDMAAAEKFYKNVIGWTAAPFEGSPTPYTTFSRKGGVRRRRADEDTRGHALSAVLVHVHRRAEL